MGHIHDTNCIKVTNTQKKGYLSQVFEIFSKNLKFDGTSSTFSQEDVLRDGRCSEFI